MEEAPLLAQCTGGVGAPPLRRQLAAPVAAELAVGDELRLVAGNLGDVELRQGNVGDGPQEARVLAPGAAPVSGLRDRADSGACHTAARRWAVRELEAGRLSVANVLGRG